jgi:hypothetical protein
MLGSLMDRISKLGNSNGWFELIRTPIRRTLDGNAPMYRLSPPTMRNATVAVAGCCWWSGLPIVGVFWLIEPRQSLIEPAHQLGNPFG